MRFIYINRSGQFTLLSGFYCLLSTATACHNLSGCILENILKLNLKRMA